jgi:hypothetical protein
MSARPGSAHLALVASDVVLDGTKMARVQQHRLSCVESLAWRRNEVTYVSTCSCGAEFRGCEKPDGARDLWRRHSAEQSDVTLVTELSDISAQLGTKMFDPPRSFVVRGHDSELRFEQYAIDRTHPDQWGDSEIAGWRYAPRLTEDVRSILKGRRVSLLVIND